MSAFMTCNCLYSDAMSLPKFHMTAGDSKRLIIPIYTRDGRPIDASGMTARLAITDFVGVCNEPLVIKNCTVMKGAADNVAVLFVQLDPTDTIYLYGCYLYQITAKDIDGDFGIMRGKLYIYRNGDRAGINM